jgi:hypothetical protein
MQAGLSPGRCQRIAKVNLMVLPSMADTEAAAASADYASGYRLLQPAEK